MLGIPSEIVGPVIGGLVAFSLAGINWLWSLSGRSSTIEFLDRRLTALEKSSEARSQRMDEMGQRLARIEGMLSQLVENTRKEV
jgi:hypothetical protein